MPLSTPPAHLNPGPPIRRDELVQPFFQALKPPAEYRIGAEAEKFGVDLKTFAPIGYDGEKGVLAIMDALVERHGWHPEREKADGPLIALSRSGASITLEPGAQLELSGAPLQNIHQVCLELSGHLGELRDISRELNIGWLGVGFHPFATQADLPWVPKGRYAIMRRYLPTKGRYGLDMMRRTATVQANFDYESEADAMRKLRLSLRLSPLVTAMFANSPFFEGRIFGGKSARARVWLDVDPARQGLIRDVLERGEKFEQYVEWALDAPMFLFKRDGAIVDNAGQTFRDFMTNGFNGEKPVMADWELHLNTLFPEVRLKRTIEVRSADAQSAALSCGIPALWTGILYDSRALAEAERLVESFAFEELSALREEIPFKALNSTFRGQPLSHLANQVLDIARQGLVRRGRLNRNGQDESVHLEKIAELIANGRSPADVLVDGLDPNSADLQAQIFERSRISVP